MPDKWGRLRLPHEPQDPRGRWAKHDHTYHGGSAQIAWLLAWIEAVLAHDTEKDVLAALETLGLREQARASGRIDVATHYRDKIPQHLLPLFALPDNEAIDKLLGGWEEVHGTYEWHTGMAGLTFQEFQALALELSGFTPWEIRDSMARRRTKRLPSLSIATIDSYRSRAKAKLRVLFHTPP